jgi:hypothetical protein
MIIDVGRSARTSWFRFFDPPLPITAASLPPSPASRAAIGFFVARAPLTRVRWYFAPPDAKPLPGGTIFAGDDFDDDAEKCVVKYGELPFAPDRKWDRGVAPAGASGQHFCGTSFDFLHPHLHGESLPCVQRGATGLLVCCNPYLAGAIGWTLPPDIQYQLVLTSVPTPQPSVSSLTLTEPATPTGELYLSFLGTVAVPSALEFISANAGRLEGGLAFSGIVTKFGFLQLALPALVPGELALTTPTIASGTLDLSRVEVLTSELVLTTGQEISHVSLVLTSAATPVPGLTFSEVSISLEPLLLAENREVRPAFIELTSVGVELDPLELAKLDFSPATPLLLTSLATPLPPLLLTATVVHFTPLELSTVVVTIGQLEFQSTEVKASSLSLTAFAFPRDSALELVTLEATPSTLALASLLVPEPTLWLYGGQVVPAGLELLDTIIIATGPVELTAPATSRLSSLKLGPVTTATGALLLSSPRSPGDLAGDALQLAGLITHVGAGALELSSIQTSLSSLEFVTPGPLQGALVLTSDAAMANVDSGGIVLDPGAYGLNASCCPLVQSPLRFSASVSAPGYSFDGTVAHLDGSYVAPDIEWRNGDIINSLGHGTVEVDSFASFPGALNVSLLWFDNSPAHTYNANMSLPEPIASCNPWSFSYSIEIVKDGVPTGDFVTIALSSIP